jgi:hypothetical protein
VKLEHPCQVSKDSLIILRITGAVAPRRRIMEKRVAKSLEVVEPNQEIMLRRLGFLMLNYFNLGFVNDCIARRACFAEYTSGRFSRGRFFFSCRVLGGSSI